MAVLLTRNDLAIVRQELAHRERVEWSVQVQAAFPLLSEAEIFARL